MSDLIHSKLIIIGSGPAGYTASIYSARSNLHPLLITGENQGGQLINTNSIENWPGYKNISGPELMERMYLHSINLDTKIIFDHIVKANLQIRPFYLNGKNKNYSCDALIIATGSSPRYLGLISEEIYKGKGVSTCATCDGFFYKNKKVAVVGGGSTAIEETLYLSNIVNTVYLIHRRETFRSEKILVDRLMEKVKKGNIILYTNCIVQEIIGNKKYVTGIVIKMLNDSSYKELEVSGVFVAIGQIPNTSIFKSQLLMKNNYIITKIKSHNRFTETSVSGVFAAGDVIYNSYCQAITAAATGCMSAIDADKFLRNI